jgi:hypothetical protein
VVRGLSYTSSAVSVGSGGIRNVGPRGRAVEAHASAPHQRVERLAMLSLGALLQLGVHVHQIGN